MSGIDDEPFYVGYLPLPRRLVAFLGTVAAFGIAAAVALPLLLSAADRDPGGGMATGDATLTGLLVARPYPILRLPPDAAHPAGHAVLVSGDGKNGVEAEAERLGGRAATLAGFMLKRGTLDMMVIGQGGSMRAMADGAASAPVPATPVARGRWRIAGEICDGKCSAGVMRPGSGLAHKACASLCLAGGIPPVLVLTRPVEGQGFLLLADAAGGAAPAAFTTWVGQPVVLEGALERLDDLLILRVDWDKVTLP